MKTFDYITAWTDVAKPAFDALPEAMHTLLARVAASTEGLAQLPDCSMPWPDSDQTLEAAFHAADIDDLAFAARVIYFTGHWYFFHKGGDGGTHTLVGRNHGASWKFAHYADQTLREKLGLPARGQSKDFGIGYEVHDGAVRVTYATKDSWSWTEVAPATQDGLAYAKSVAIRTDGSDPKPMWPERWQPFMNSEKFMIEEQDMKAREAARPEAVTKIRADLVARFAKKAEQEEIELEGKLWLLDHGLSIDNVIYYSHTGDFTFGWQDKVSPKTESAILEVISEFRWPYHIRCADGRVLSGGQG